MPNHSWTREELILALDLYKRFSGIIPDTKHPEIIALASYLSDLALLHDEHQYRAGRSKASIVYKLSNFRSLDPLARARGKLGYSNVGTLDRVIWREFADEPLKLRSAADEIRLSIDAARVQLEPLRANIHLLRLVGDELIGSIHLAVFELVKNAYDADAKKAEIHLDLISDSPSIVVTDDGCGMDLNTIRRGWLQLGGPLKRGEERKRTPKFNRMPLGEKGIGRLAAFKLGSRLELVTRTETENIEYHVMMDMSALLEGNESSETSIEDVRVRVKPRSPELFTEDNYGTYIRISALRNDLQWQRKQVRSLHRLVTTLVNPFSKLDTFAAVLKVPGHEGWIKDLLSINDIKKRSVYRFEFRIDADGKFWWNYRFTPPSVFRSLKASNTELNWIHGKPSRLDLEEFEDEVSADRPGRPPKGDLLLSEKQLRGVGPVKGRFYVYDRRTEILRKMGGEPKQVKDFLDEQSGVRVYRDGVRVYNYGERGDDWLGLNAERVNRPGHRLATNSVIAAVELDAEKSRGLVEKTNREGFDENNCFAEFHRIINSVVDFFNRTRQQDRDDLDEALKPKDQVADPSVKFEKAVEEVRAVASRHGLEKELTPKINRILKEYQTLQDAAISAGAGLNIAVLFHEAERGIKAIVEAINRKENLDALKVRANHVASLLEGFAALFKKEKPKVIPASRFLERVRQLHLGRFEAHRITFSCPVLNKEDPDFNISGALNYYLAAISNLIDNAIYWTRRAREENGPDFLPAIAIRTLADWAAEGPAIAVTDNGHGFTIDPEMAVRPFVSARAGGMGLGLYFAKMVMETQGGNLLIIQDPDDLDIENTLPGAAVVMRFRRSK